MLEGGDPFVVQKARSEGNDRLAVVTTGGDSLVALDVCALGTIRNVYQPFLSYTYLSMLSKSTRQTLDTATLGLDGFT